MLHARAVEGADARMLKRIDTAPNIPQRWICAFRCEGFKYAGVSAQRDDISYIFEFLILKMDKSTHLTFG
jgi:hypothetical protein